MTVNVDVLDVDRGSEGLEGIVVETMQRSHQAQVLRDALGDGLRQDVILHGESDVTAKEVEGIEFAVFVVSIARSAAQRNDSSKTASSFQGRKALEQFRSDIAIGAEENGVGRGIQDYRGSRGVESVNMFREERNEGGIRHESESQRSG